MNRLVNAIIGGVIITVVIEAVDEFIEKRRFIKMQKQHEEQDRWFKLGWNGGYNHAMIETGNSDKVIEY